MLVVGTLATTAVPASAVTLFLDAARGRVVDEDTGEPIPDARVIQWWHGAGAMGEPAPSLHARLAVSDERGRFAFERALAPSPWMWVSRTYGPTYGFYHPSYGLETGTPRRVETPGAHEPALVLQGSLRRSHLRLAEVRAYCHGRREGDAAAPRLREIACPLEAHEVWPTGVPRAEGERDARGRRTGTWTFHYADGSVAARGAYRAGGAVGEWTFYDRSGERVD